MNIFCMACVLQLVEVSITNLRAVTMHHNKDTQKVMIFIEVTLWILLALFFSLSYLLT